MAGWADPDREGLRSDLRAITGDGVAFSVMVGVGESYVPAFALALGMGNVTAGLVATLPMVVGAVMQLVTPFGVRRLDSHRRWVVACACLQGASFLPLIAAAYWGALSRTLLFATVSLYWAFGMATSPAWNTWVGTLVPAEMRARFFARRNRWAHAALLAGLVLGGAILEAGSREERAMLSFALVFAVACAMRGLSAYFLASQSEPRPIPLGDTRISAAAFVEHAREGGHGRLLVYLLVLQLAVWIAAPFFTPYMLGTLGLSYAQFTSLTGIALAARIAALPRLGRFAHRRGTRRLLWLGALGVIPLPALWLVSDAFAWLLTLQVFAGVAWGAFELATLLSFFEHIPETRRTTVLSMYNLASALAIVGGSLIGTALLRSFDHAGGAFALVFLVSSSMRVLALFFLRRAPDVSTPDELMPLRTLAVRPSAGAIQRPVLAGLSDAETEPAAPQRRAPRSSTRAAEK